MIKRIHLVYTGKLFKKILAAKDKARHYLGANLSWNDFFEILVDDSKYAQRATPWAQRKRIKGEKVHQI